MNPNLFSVDDLRSLQYVNGTLDVTDNPNLIEAKEFLNGLGFIKDYVFIDFFNGTIHCPEGTSTLYGHRSVMDPREDFEIDLEKGTSQLSGDEIMQTEYVEQLDRIGTSEVPEAIWHPSAFIVGQSSGNWCTFLCNEKAGFTLQNRKDNHPEYGPFHHWQTRANALWNESWSPSCVKG